MSGSLGIPSVCGCALAFSLSLSFSLVFSYTYSFLVFQPLPPSVPFSTRVWTEKMNGDKSSHFEVSEDREMKIARQRGADGLFQGAWMPETEDDFQLEAVEFLVSKGK